MDRFWFLTSTTYGTWLPGDKRGFVGANRNALGIQVVHNLPGMEYDCDVAWLRDTALNQLTGPPVVLARPHAEVLFRQFYETARHRRWNLSAVGIMATHIHIVVGVWGDPAPASLLRDFKSYGSRALNRNWRRPQSETWWAESGSKRRLPDESAVLAAIEYIRRQPNPLLIWIAGEDPPPVVPEFMSART